MKTQELIEVLNEKIFEPVGCRIVWYHNIISPTGVESEPCDLRYRDHCVFSWLDCNSMLLSSSSVFNRIDTLKAFNVYDNTHGRQTIVSAIEFAALFPLFNMPRCESIEELELVLIAKGLI